MINIEATRGKKMLRRFIAAVAVATAMTTTSIPAFAAEAPANPLQGQIAHNNVVAFMQANMKYLIQQVLTGDYTFFDPVAYLKANPDLAQQFGGNIQAAINHYFTVGALEGRASMGKFDFVAAIVSHPECVASGKLDVASVVTAFAQATGQPLDSVTTAGIVIGSTADGALGVASVAPDSPAAATTTVSTGMTFTGGAATNSATNNSGNASASNSTGSFTGSSSSSSDSSSSSSDDDGDDNHSVWSFDDYIAADNHSVRSFDDYIAAVPMAENFSSFEEYDAALGAWTQAGLALGYVVATPGGEYSHALTKTAWFDVSQYLYDQGQWKANEPSLEKELEDAGYYDALAAWEAGKPDETDYSYSVVAYETAVANWEDAKPTYLEFMSPSDVADYNEAVADWKDSKPQATEYLYNENATYATEFQAKAAWAAHVRNRFASLGISDFTGVYPTWAEYAPYVDAPAAWAGYTSEENAVAGYQSDMNAWAVAVRGIRFEHAIDNYNDWKLTSVPSGIDTTDDIAMARAYIAYLNSITDEGQAEAIAEKLSNSAYTEPNAEDYVFDAEGYAEYTAAAAARAAYEAYEAYQSGVIDYKDAVDTYIALDESDYATAITTNADNAINNFEEYDYNKYASQDEADAAYDLALDAWEEQEPEPANHITNETQRTMYGNAIVAWEALEPDVADFIGTDGTFDELHYNAALTVWNSKKPNYAEYMTEAERNAYADAILDWESNQPHAADYVYNEEYYANEAAAQAAKEADLAEYNALMNTTVTTANVWVFDGNVYDHETTATQKYNEYMAANANRVAIQNTTLADYVVHTWEINGTPYEDEDEAIAKFLEYKTEQDALKAISDSTLDDYERAVDVYKFGGNAYLSDDSSANTAFIAWKTEQGQHHNIDNLYSITQDEDFDVDTSLSDNHHTNAILYCIGDDYFTTDNEEAAEAARKAYNKKTGGCQLLEEFETLPYKEYWEFDEATYGEYKLFVLDAYSTSTEFIKEAISDWRGNFEDVDEDYNPSKSLEDYAATDAGWVINNVTYIDDDEATAKLTEYKGWACVDLDEDWSTSRTLEDCQVDYYEIDNTYYKTTSEYDRAVDALDEYQMANVPSGDYNAENTIEAYVKAWYTYAGAEQYYEDAEAATNALNDAKNGASDPEEGDYTYNEYASQDAATAAFNAALNSYLAANPEPQESDYTNNEEYEAAKAEWAAAKPDEDDYKRDEFAEEVFDDATESYETAHPAPDADDYAQHTDPEAGHYVDIENKHETWEASKPEKEDYSYESDDDDEASVAAYSDDYADDNDSDDGDSTS